MAAQRVQHAAEEELAASATELGDGDVEGAEEVSSGVQRRARRRGSLRRVQVAQVIEGAGNGDGACAAAASDRHTLLVRANPHGSQQRQAVARRDDEALGHEQPVVAVAVDGGA